MDGRGIRSRDWTSYPVLTFADAPPVEVVLVPRPGLQPLGAGEASTPPVASAVANAIDDAIGVRLRDLPFTADGLQRRLLELSEDEMDRALVS